MKQNEVPYWLKRGDHLIIARICNCARESVSRAIKRPSQRSNILRVAKLLAEKRKKQAQQKFAREH